VQPDRRCNCTRRTKRHSVGNGYVRHADRAWRRIVRSPATACGDNAFLLMRTSARKLVYLDQVAQFRDNFMFAGYQMRLARAIVGILVAASIALLPATTGMASPKSTTVVTSPHHCCDDEDMPMQIPMGMKDCQSSAGCAFKCFGLYGVTFAGPTLQAPRSEQPHTAIVQILDTVRTSPPLRPPRA